MITSYDPSRFRNDLLFYDYVPPELRYQYMYEQWVYSTGFYRSTEEMRTRSILNTMTTEIKIHSTEEQRRRGTQHGIETKRQRQALNAQAIVAILQQADRPLTVREIQAKLIERNNKLSLMAIRNILCLEQYWPEGQQLQVWIDPTCPTRQRKLYQFITLS